MRAGKHVILVGPPGVGKTDLAKRVLATIGKNIMGNDCLESVASDEWGRYDLIGGMGIDNMNSKSKFQMGWITKAAVENKWLLIDEFNRANMNKAFGEMFLAIGYHKITLQPRESEAYGITEPIEIPENFRMICTMNDFDKNLLLTELSYGLINRFAFVSVMPDGDRERIVVENRVKSIPGNNDAYEKCKDQISLDYMFINKVRNQRNIGVRTSIDIVAYLTAAVKGENNINDNYKLQCLNDALCSCVLPQFDRLDSSTINAVLDDAKSYLVEEAFNPFKAELQKASDKLQKAVGWLTEKK
ncbi:MAG: AAA family ATPase [Thermoproteota archaeon]|nr:AAA family ATPase [Thermoproteota archaeon]